MKKLNHVNIENENPPYLIFNNVDRCIEESNGDEYLVFAFTDKNKEILTNIQKFGMKLKIILKR